jgi:hypothetical protein
MPASYARRQRKAKTKTKQFSLDSKDIGKLYDVIFASPPDPKYADQVTAFAAPAGREAIGKVLPNSEIAWRPLAGSNAEVFPDDWLEFTFVMDNVASHPANKLPQYLLDLRPLEDCTPDQLCYLMMVATNAQGGRAAFWSQTENELIQVQLADQAQFMLH